MSAYSGKLEEGMEVYLKKTVKSWYFTADGGCHNTDVIIIEFTDGTTHKGLSGIIYDKSY